MALQKQIMPIPLSGGLDEKPSDKHLTPPKLTQCDNGRFDKSGQVQKRNGFTQSKNLKVDTSAISAAKQCASYKDERLIFDGNNAYSISDSGTWVDKGRVTGCTYENNYVERDDSLATSPLAAASKNGYRVESWAETTADSEYVSGVGDLGYYYWHIFTRVIDEATGLEVVSKTRITPTAGLKVTQSYSPDNRYFNPNVQCVNIGNYLYTLFNDCEATTISLGFASTESGTGGKTQVNMTGSNFHGFLENDVITIASSTDLDGAHVITECDPDNNSFLIASVTYSGSTQTGTVTGSGGTYTDKRTAVYASKVDTSGGVAAALTPTSFSVLDADPSSGAYVAPVFYVNGHFPTLWSLDKLATAPLSDGACIFRLNPLASATTGGSLYPNYRVDYLQGTDGTITEYLRNGFAGYRGKDTVITDADFYVQSAGGNALYFRVLSRVCCRVLNDDDTVVVAATFGVSVTTQPQIKTQTYIAETLEKTDSSTTQQAMDERVLVSGSIEPTGSTAHFVFTGQVAYNARSDASNAQPSPHSLFKSTLTIATGALTSAEVLRRFTTLTTDLFTYNSKVYYGATYAVSPNGDVNTTETDIVNYGSSINLIGDTDGNIVATGGTGLGGVCATTDWQGPYSDGRMFFVGPARVNTANSPSFSFGSSKVAGAVTQISFGVRVAFNPAYGVVDLDPPRNLANVEASGALMAAGGVLWEYGGDVFKESGFLTYPQFRHKFLSRTITSVADSAVDGYVTIKTTTGSYAEPGTSFTNGNTVVITGTTSYDGTFEVANVDFANGTFDVLGTFGLTKSGTASIPAGVLSDGTYKYKCIYEWTALNGSIQRSYPSETVELTLSAGGSAQAVQLNVYTPQWTQKREANGITNPRIVLYRTTAGGSVFYRVVDEAVVFDNAWQGILDAKLTDDNITDNEQIYTTGVTGDVFGNIPPPSCTDIALHKNRVFVATSESSIWYSKKLSSVIAPEFSDFQVKPIENYTGKIACLGVVRDYIIAITKEHGYLLAGDGPNAAGQGSDFSPPTVFARDAGAALGCARSSTSVGFIYNAHGGIYKINPSMQAQFIGSAVEDLATTDTPTSIAANDSRGEIYIGLDSDDAGILVYNYVFNAWSKWVPWFAEDTTITSLMVHNNLLNFVMPDGYLVTQNTGFTDIDDSGIVRLPYMIVTTPWLRTQQFLHLLRFYNVLISGTYKSAHTLNCTIYYNYDDDTSETQSKVLSSAPEEPYIFRKHVRDQKSRAIKIKIYDTPGSGTNEGFYIDGIAIQFGVPKGTVALGTTKTLTGS